MSRIFDGLFGNEAIKERFAAMIRSGTLPHAFIIDGPSGSGKRTLAYEVAAALSCENKKSRHFPLPCRACNTCRRIFEGAYTDIKELDRSAKASIGVGEVKDFKEDMFLSATESEFKVYIINNAQLLTPQAQNALLTVMEEPPAGVVIFLLTSSQDKILTTIKSRAQYAAMQKFSPEELDKYLRDSIPEARAAALADKERYDAVIMRADGCIGEAISLLNPAKAEEAEAERRIIKKFISSLDVRAPYSELFAALSSLPDSRQELTRAIEEIIAAVSDMIKAKSSVGEISTEFFTNTEEAREASKAISQRRLFAVSELLLEAYEHLSKNASVQAVISSLAAKIRLL